MSTPYAQSNSALRANWGFALFSIASLLTLVKLLRQPMPGHYRVFVGAAHALWNGQNPYGSTFGTGIGYYFYSPTCALFFFGPFAALPEKIGLAAYMVFSWIVFVYGASRMLDAAQSRIARHALGVPDAGSWRSWFWIAIAFQMAGGILASKLEILIAGIILLVGAWLIERRRLALCAVLLAIVINWKFQPLPIAGLMALTLLLVDREWRFPVGLAVSLATLYAVPLLIVPPSLLVESHRVWGETFAQFIGVAWLDFENIFAFARNTLGLTLSYRTAQGITAAAGLAFAGATAAWLLRLRGSAPTEERRREGILWSLGLGSAFVCALSPLGQNNALILFAPLLLVALHEFDASAGRARTLWRIVLAVCVIPMAIAYSDAVPHALQLALRHATIKPVCCLALAVALIASGWARTRIRPPAGQLSTDCVSVDTVDTSAS